MVGRAIHYQISEDSAIRMVEPAEHFGNRFLHPLGSGGALAGVDCIILSSTLGALSDPVRGGTDQHQSLRASIRNHGYLQFIIDRLAQAGARRVMVCVGSPSQGRSTTEPVRSINPGEPANILSMKKPSPSLKVIKQASGVTPGMVVEWLVDPQAVGVAAMLKLAMPYCRSQPIFVLKGDRLVSVDFGAALISHRRGGGGLTMVVSPMRQNREVAAGLEKISLSAARRVLSIDEMGESSPARLDRDQILTGESRQFLSSGVFLFDYRALTVAAASGCHSLEFDYLGKMPEGTIQALIQDQPIFRSQKPAASVLSTERRMEG
ncbi:MAG: sugar phosphate nucleotidyltransferase [Candidatus Pacebacteria bacterium]|nr:sugar phosphate nucleotidyltransferase [Candidatus Paceibacterota bacterium]